MSRRVDDDRLWWFGPTWDAPVNTIGVEAVTPVDDVCLFCPQPIRLGDRGLLLGGPMATVTRLAVHLDCFLRATVPPPWSDVWDAAGHAGAEPVITEEGETYRVIAVDGRPAIQCRLCDRISENRSDVHNRYCGRCHVFHDLVAEARRHLREGGTHDCGEWRTGRDACALCGAALRPKEDR